MFEGALEVMRNFKLDTLEGDTTLILKFEVRHYRSFINGKEYSNYA